MGGGGAAAGGLRGVGGSETASALYVAASRSSPLGASAFCSGACVSGGRGGNSSSDRLTQVLSDGDLGYSVPHGIASWSEMHSAKANSKGGAWFYRLGPIRQERCIVKVN